MSLFNLSERFLDYNLQRCKGDCVAIISVDDGNLTYSQLFSSVKKYCTYLLSKGIRIEDRVGISMLDRIEFFIAFLATIRIGAVAVPINPELKANLPNIIHDTRMVFLFTDFQLMNDLSIESCNVIDTHWNESISSLSESVYIADTTEDSPCFWMSTSGTTGKSKYVIQRHLSPIVIAQLIGEFEHPYRYFCPSPLFFSYGLCCSLFYPLYSGGTAILCASRPVPPQQVLDIAATYKPDMIFWVPSGYASLLHYINHDSTHPATNALKSIQRGYSAGEALSPVIRQRIHQYFGVLLNDYTGASESGPVIGNGQPFQGITVKLDEQGVLYVKTPALAYGYYNNYEATRSQFQGEWFCTQDVYTYYEDGRGYVYEGRADNLLKVYGRWVSPIKIEDCMKKHMNVQDACCVGQQNDVGLLETVFFIILKDKSQVFTIDTVTSHCLEHGLESYLIPRKVQCVDTFPMTSTGKILRKELRLVKINDDNNTQGNTENSSSFTIMTKEAFLNILYKVSPVHGASTVDNTYVDMSKTLMDNGLDSSAIARLVQSIKASTHVGIPMNIVFSYTLEALVAYIISIQEHVKSQSSHDDQDVSTISGETRQNISTVVLPVETPIDYTAELCIIDSTISKLKSLQVQDRKSKTVFLTGCTGHLGIFILNDLLRQEQHSGLSSWDPYITHSSNGNHTTSCHIPDDTTKEYYVKKVYVLIRDDGISGSKEKFKAVAKMNGLSGLYDDPRIHILQGDLKSKFLGLSSADWNELVETVDIVIHNGAEVSWIKPYSALKLVNVESTKYILDLCCNIQYDASVSISMTANSKSTKQLVYISSVGAYHSAENKQENIDFSMQDNTSAVLNSMMGYGAGKRLSEIMIQEARRYGLKVSIVRPGTISGSYVTGSCNPNDTINRFIHTVAQLGIYPEVSADYKISMVPVEYVTAVITTVALSPSHTNGYLNYTVVGDPPVPMTLLIQAIYSYLQKLITPVPLAVFTQQAHIHGSRIVPVIDFFDQLNRLPIGDESQIYTHENTVGLKLPFPEITLEVLTSYVKFLLGS